MCEARNKQLPYFSTIYFKKNKRRSVTLAVV